MIDDKKRRIQVISIEAVEDPGGGILPGVETIYWDTFAGINPISTTYKNSRLAQAYQTYLEEPREFKLRYRKDKKVTKNMLIRYNEIDYTIQSTIDINLEKQEITIIGLARK